MAFEDYNASASLNTSISGINIAENSPAANVNNAIRQLMADAKVFSSRFTPDPRTFGVVGDGVADDRSAWQAFIDYCVLNELPITSNVTMLSKISGALTISDQSKVVEPSTGLYVNTPIDLRTVTFLFTGSRDQVVLDIGAAITLYQHGTIWLPSIIAYGALSWPKTIAQLLDTPSVHIDTAVRFRNMFNCEIHEALIYGFSKGIEHVGTRYCRIFGGDIADCRLGRVWTTSGADHDASFTNENTIISGLLRNSGNAAALTDAYGDVFTWDQTSSYRGHNANRFYSVTYELGAPAPATYRVPVFMDGVGGLNKWYSARQEGNKGPFAICDGGGATVYCFNNEFDVIYNTSSSGQGEYVLQVNGAYGNRYTGPGANEHRWESGDLKRFLTTNGGADAPYLAGPCFFMDTSVGTPVRALSIAGRVATARDAIHLWGCGIFAAVDTANIKNFRIALAAKPNFEGQVFIAAFDASGNRLTGNATDATWGNEPYVKGGGLSANAGYGGGYTMGSENISSDILITVRSEVKKIHVGYIWGGAWLGMQSFSVTGYSTPENLTYTDAKAGMRVFADVDDPGTFPLSTAKPDTAGTHGYIAKGQIFGNASAAAGQPAGWQGSTAGFLAAAWAASTSYPLVGRIVTNDTGKMYELTTAGTSAGAGGPTGTTATWDGITDGTAKWRYIGVKGATVTLANTT